MPLPELCPPLAPGAPTAVFVFAFVAEALPEPSVLVSRVMVLLG